MMLCWNVVVSEWRYVGMLLCRNGDMLGYELSGYVIYGDKRTDDRPLTSSAYQRSSKVITGHKSFSKAIKISHQCVSSMWLINVPH